MTLTLDQQHQYLLDGKRIPSVTEILGDLKLTPPYPEGNYAALGTRVHKLCELMDTGELDKDAFFSQDAKEPDPKLRLRPYLDAYQEFLTDSRAEVIYVEKRLASHRYWFAGTLDRIIRMGDTYGILDLKKTTSIARSTELQTAGYEILARETKLVAVSDIRRWALALKPNGTYQLIEYNSPNDCPGFLGAVSLWRWLKSR